MKTAANLLVIALIFLGQPTARADVGPVFLYLAPDAAGRWLPTLGAASGAVALANIDSITPPALSRDGGTVAFSGAAGDESLGEYAIFLVGTDGRGLRQLTSGAFAEVDPDWSPDGSTLVAAQNTTGLLTQSGCCRLVTVDAVTGDITALTPNVGAARPEFSSDGTKLAYDTPVGIWTIDSDGDNESLVSGGGFDASWSPNDEDLVFLSDSGATMHINRVPAGGGPPSNLYSTKLQVEQPFWVGNRIYFTEYGGLGYDGRRNVALRSVSATGGNPRTEHSSSQRLIGISDGADNDEIFFYRTDGLFRFYEIRTDGTLPSPMLAGDKYTIGWSSIAGVDLDGDGNDEMFFYRVDGLFRYYNVNPNGTLPGPLVAGNGYTVGWDSITSVDLDGDGQDEMFFYRDDGLFRYYNVNADGSLPAPLLAGDSYSKGWDSITAVDLDGDGQDEMFFYRQDGLFRFYDIRANGVLGAPINGGVDFGEDWDHVAAIDLDGDGRDELLLYRGGGEFEYHTVSAEGELKDLVLSGTGYTGGWSIISGVNLDLG